MREIERENYILLQKIMTCSNGPSKSHFSYNVSKVFVHCDVETVCNLINLESFNHNPKSSIPQNEPQGSRKASAAVNRKKKQRQISLDNQVPKSVVLLV